MGRNKAIKLDLGRHGTFRYKSATFDFAHIDVKNA